MSTLSIPGRVALTAIDTAPLCVWCDSPATHNLGSFHDLACAFHHDRWFAGADAEPPCACTWCERAAVAYARARAQEVPGRQVRARARLVVPTRCSHRRWEAERAAVARDARAQSQPWRRAHAVIDVVDSQGRHALGQWFVTVNGPAALVNGVAA